MDEFITRLPGETLVRWKPITWEQYRVLISVYGTSLDEAAGWLLCEAAAAICFISLEQEGTAVEFEDLYAGTIYVVGRQIIETTGFISTVPKINENLGRAREAIQSDWYESAKAVVCVTFRLEPEEVEKWSLKKFMHYVAMIETATGQQFPVIDPEEEKAGSQKFKVMPDGRKIPILTKDDLRRKRNIDTTGVE
jgi:hypothetical protein